MSEANVADRTSGTVAGHAGKPFGPVAAAFLAAGIGGVVLGILTTLVEASEGIKSALEFSARVGSLSGKTIIAVATWLVAWAILHTVLKGKNVDSKKAFTWTAILFAVAAILTFPIFFQMFAPPE